MDSLATYEGLVKRYKHGAAVDGLDFEVVEGSVSGLLGPNGAGKTTAIRVLLGLAKPSAGGTKLLGAAPGSREFADAVHQVGSLIEGPAFYGRATARQNMRIEADSIGLKDARPQIDNLLDLVGLSARADTKARSFSLGMKQRLGLAMALLGEPRLVVLDEPTNGLDPAGIVEIRELIKQLPARGTTVLVSSHLLSEVQLMCDRAAILQRGKLIAEGTIDELIAVNGGSGFLVRVAVERAVAAEATLERLGMEVSMLEQGMLRVAGEIEDGIEISRPLAQAGIHVSELTPQRVDLEQVFLALTDGAGDRADLPVAAIPSPDKSSGGEQQGRGAR